MVGLAGAFSYGQAWSTVANVLPLRPCCGEYLEETFTSVLPPTTNYLKTLLTVLVIETGDMAE